MSRLLRPTRLIAGCIFVGVLAALWLAALQFSAAMLAREPWIIDRPLEALAFYAVIGGVVGAFFGVLGAASSLVLPFGFCASAALLTSALSPTSLRLFATSKLHALGWSGSLSFAFGGLFLILAVALPALERASQPDLRRRTSAALALGLWCALAVQLGHEFWVVDVAEQDGNGLRGAAALVTMTLALALGVGAWHLGQRARPRWMASVGLVIAAATGATLLGVSTRVPQHAPGSNASSPNVLLVVLDTLRRDSIGAYGATEGATPMLDRLASQGLLWEDALAAGSWTVPSHASLFTGVPVSRHGAGHMRNQLRERPAGPGTPRLATLAELVRDSGHATGAIIANPSLSRGRGFERGFERYLELYKLRPHDHDALEFLRRAVFKRRPDKGGARAVRATLAWIDARTDPWFCFLNLNEVHRPYNTAPDAYTRRFLDRELAPATRRLIMGFPPYAAQDYGERELDELYRLYLAATAYQDMLLGELLRGLDERSLRDETIVVVTSDHGEHFGWNGLLGHGQSLADEMVRVPLIARGPGLQAGLRSNAPVSHLDLFASILEWTDAPKPEPDPGHLGVPLGSDGAAGSAARLRVAERYPTFLEHISEFQELGREVGFDVDPFWAWGRARLFAGACTLEVVDGPAEEELRCGSERAEDEALRSELARQLAALRERWSHALDEAPADEPEEVLERVRALGYAR